MSDLAHRAWFRAFTDLCTILEDAGAIFTIEGDKYIDETLVSPAVLGMYEKHVSVGMAKGWL